MSTRQIAESADATGMAQNKSAAQTGGRIARQARNQLEGQTGKSVVTGANYLPPVAAATKTGNALKPAKVLKAVEETVDATQAAQPVKAARKTRNS